MFEPVKKFASCTANDAAIELINTYLMNYTQKVLLTGITRPYTNLDCFKPEDSPAIEVSRRCLTSALQELDEDADAWEKVAATVRAEAPELLGSCSTDDIHDNIITLCTTLLVYATFKLDQKESIVASAIVRHAVAEAAERVGDDSGELDEDDDPIPLTEEDVFCVFNTDDCIKILNLSGDAWGKYDAGSLLYRLGDIRNADEYWFGLEPAQTKD